MPNNVDVLDFGLPQKIYAMHERKAAANDQARGPRTASSNFWMSELGKCGRALTYARLGDFPSETPNGKSQRIFKMGDLIEANVVQELKDAGFKVEFTGSQQKRVSIKVPPVSGRIDGIITGVIDKEKVTRLLELKSMNTRGVAELKSKGLKTTQLGYFIQIQFYLFALQLTEATVLVEDKNTQELYEERITYDPLFVADRVLWAMYVQGRIEAEKLAEPEYAKSSWQCRYCSYSSHCSGLAESEPAAKPARRVAKVAGGA